MVKYLYDLHVGLGNRNFQFILLILSNATLTSLAFFKNPIKTLHYRQMLQLNYFADLQSALLVAEI